MNTKLLEISNSIIEAIHQSGSVDTDSLDALAILSDDGKSCSFEMQKYHEQKIPEQRMPVPIGRTIYKVTITASYEKYDEDD